MWVYGAGNAAQKGTSSTSYHALRISIFGTICPAEFCQNFKSNFAFGVPGGSIFHFLNKKSHFECLPSCI